MSWVGLVIYLAVFVAGLASGLKIHAGLDAQAALQAQESQAKELIRKVDKIGVAAQGLEDDKSAVEAKFRVVTKEVLRVVEKPVYLNMCFDDDGLRAIDEALRAPAGDEPATALPRPGKAK